MKTLSDTLWIEMRKALRSKMPLYTALGSLLIPLAMAFMLFVSRNPEVSRQLGLISAKATLISDTASNWPAYLATFAQILAMAGMILFVLAISWVFGREFTDGTLKDLLAVPVPRLSILVAKYIVVALWSAALAVLLFGLGLGLGMLFHLPGGSTAILLQGCERAAITTGLVITAMLPFAFFASLGRGYLLPIGVCFMALILANLVMAAGWGEYFPWAILAIYAQGKEALPLASFAIVLLTGLLGLVGTYLWWQYADQNK
ncbi:MAG: ABC transporter permease [Anaerolineales bacterium]|jgi:ABC-2 type transport system permease protein